MKNEVFPILGLVLITTLVLAVSGVAYFENNPTGMFSFKFLKSSSENNVQKDNELTGDALNVKKTTSSKVTAKALPPPFLEKLKNVDSKQLTTTTKFKIGTNSNNNPKQRPAPSISCTDSGNKIVVKVGFTGVSGQTKVYEDGCYGNDLVDFYCLKDKQGFSRPKSSNYTCDLGCSKDMKTGVSKCNSPVVCKPVCAGNNLNNYQSLGRTCNLTSSTLCQNGCSNGACVSCTDNWKCSVDSLTGTATETHTGAGVQCKVLEQNACAFGCASDGKRCNQCDANAAPTCESGGIKTQTVNSSGACQIKNAPCSQGLSCTYDVNGSTMCMDSACTIGVGVSTCDGDPNKLNGTNVVVKTRSGDQCVSTVTNCKLGCKKQGSSAVCNSGDYCNSRYYGGDGNIYTQNATGAVLSKAVCLAGDCYAAAPGYVPDCNWFMGCYNNSIVKQSYTNVIETLGQCVSGCNSSNYRCNPDTNTCPAGANLVYGSPNYVGNYAKLSCLNSTTMLNKTTFDSYTGLCSDKAGNSCPQGSTCQVDVNNIFRTNLTDFVFCGNISNSSSQEAKICASGNSGKYCEGNLLKTMNPGCVRITASWGTENCVNGCTELGRNSGGYYSAKCNPATTCPNGLTVTDGVINPSCINETTMRVGYFLSNGSCTTYNQPCYKYNDAQGICGVVPGNGTMGCY